VTDLATLTFDRKGSSAIVAVSGEIDMSNADDLLRRISEWVSNEDPMLVLDLRALTYADSAGIHMLFDLSALLREHAQAFRIVLPADSQPWRTFAIVDMASQVPIFETLAEATANPPG
jgi:anti-anti-sigma factor